jgi:hypothetical protein
MMVAPCDVRERPEKWVISFCTIPILDMVEDFTVYEGHFYLGCGKCASLDKERFALIA